MIPQNANDFLIAEPIAQTSIYPVTHATMPQLASSSNKSAKSKKKFAYYGLKKKYLISLLKQSLQDDEDDSNNESKVFFEASVANDDNPYNPYDGSLFRHDPIVTPNLAEV